MVPEAGIEPARPLLTKRRILRATFLQIIPPRKPALALCFVKNNRYLNRFSEQTSTIYPIFNMKFERYLSVRFDRCSEFFTTLSGADV